MPTQIMPLTKVVPGLSVLPVGDEHREYLRQRTQKTWNGQFVISRGKAHEPAALPGFIAMKDGEIVGVATFYIEGSECELVTIDAFQQWHGIGTVLIEAVEEEARKSACSRLWLITTNDNVDALRFYQKRGYVIAAVHINALAESRKLKPAIPFDGAYGIPLRDEIELEKYLWCWIGW